MQSSGRPGDPTLLSGMISPDCNRLCTPPRTLVLCFDGTGNQFDAVVRHATDLAVSPCVACLPPLVEHEYCTILHCPGERRQGPADGILPGPFDLPHDLVPQRLYSNSNFSPVWRRDMCYPSSPDATPSNLPKMRQYGPRKSP